VEGVPILDLCDERGLQLTVFYRVEGVFRERSGGFPIQRGAPSRQRLGLVAFLCAITPMPQTDQKMAEKTLR
jgi:hypothetical protein